jgi:hypothetical protein
LEKYNGSELFSPTSGLSQHETPGTLLRITMLVAAIAIFTAVAVPFIVEGNDAMIAFDPNEIDPRTTASIRAPAKRFTIRRSILDKQ